MFWPKNSPNFHVSLYQPLPVYILTIMSLEEQFAKLLKLLYFDKALIINPFSVASFTSDVISLC